MLTRIFLGICLFYSVCVLENAKATAIDTIGAESNPSLWINSPPLTQNDLKNKVVVIEFWTFDCINCKNTLPYMKKWYEGYKDKGLIVIGIHSPELRHERDIGNLKQAISDNEILYPVLIDNDFKVWKAFRTRFWPTIHVINKQGQIVHTQVGEGGYEATEAVIRTLLSASE